MLISSLGPFSGVVTGTLVSSPKFKIHRKEAPPIKIKLPLQDTIGSEGR